MKYIILAILTASFSANATGFKRTIFKCSSLVNGPSYSLIETSLSAPGGPVHKSTEFTKTDSDANGNSVSFSVRAVDSEYSEGTSYTQYKSIEGNSIGYLTVLEINDKVIINAKLLTTIGQQKIDTNGPLKFGENYVCTEN